MIFEGKKVFDDIEEGRKLKLGIENEKCEQQSAL